VDIWQVRFQTLYLFVYNFPFGSACCVVPSVLIKLFVWVVFEINLLYCAWSCLCVKYVLLLFLDVLFFIT